MCMQCAVIAVSMVGAAGLLRTLMFARLPAVDDPDGEPQPSPLLVLLMLAALTEHEPDASA